jgi:uncharacterized protein (TIGR01777 family)
MARRILITGATGFIGRPLSLELAKTGYEVVALSRRPAEAKNLFARQVKVAKWDAVTTEGWAELVNGSLAIINLAGENIGTGRWTEKKKKLILQSRLSAGSTITEAIQRAGQKPQVLIQASGIGYYGDRGDELLDEDSLSGTGFLADVARQWEQSVRGVEALGVRIVTIRLGIVLGAHGGVIPRLVQLFRFFVGGHPGSGKQWLAWIHVEDVIGVIRLLVENANCRGAFNVTTPEPILSKNFYGLLGNTMHRPAIFPMPAFMLKLMLGEMANELLLPSLRAVPQKLFEAGYKFKFPYLPAAFADILRLSSVNGATAKSLNSQ